MAREHRTRVAGFAAALSPAQLVRRLVDLLGPTGGAARQGLVALTINSLTSFAAGAMLVGFSSTWDRLPPMLILVPAAIGLRGNVFSTLGNRLSTAIHTGTFTRSFRRDSVLGQNLIASFGLTAVMSVLLAVIAKVIAVGLGIADTVSVLDLALIAIVGGLLGSIVVAAATVALTAGAVRFGWDLDNLVAPTVSTLGDVVTIPALFLAAKLAVHGAPSHVGGAALIVASLVAVVWTYRAGPGALRQIITESTPILAGALLLSALAGLVLQKQAALLDQARAVFVLQPAFVSSAGALGGILCGRVATNLHLGVVSPTLAPGTETRRDASLVLGLALPLLVFNVGGAFVTAWIGGSTDPGLWWLLLVATLASVFTMLFVIALAYYSTIGAWRLNVDPDSFGIPIVTAAVDFVGTMALVFAVVTLGLN